MPTCKGDGAEKASGNMGENISEKDVEQNFHKCIQKYYEYRKLHPYYYLDWRTNGENAKQCKIILHEIADALRPVVDQVVSEFGKLPYSIRVSSGASYFPKNPWIAILFHGETPTDGIYPVLGFWGEDSMGFLLGCTESCQNPKPGFAEKYCRIGNVSDKAAKALFVKAGVEDYGHLALSETTLIATYETAVSYSQLKSAIFGAIKIYCEFKQLNNSAAISTQITRPNDKNSIKDEKSWCKEVVVEDFYKILNEISALNNEKSSCWVFRGQGFEKWGLESGLGRGVQYDEDVINESVTIGRSLKERESLALYEFSSQARSEGIYRDFSKLDLLSLMQHYEGCTRLLDFTFSPLVAFFWAIHQNDDMRAKVNGFLSKYEREIADGVMVETARDVLNGAGFCIWAINLSDVLHEYEGVNIFEKIAASSRFSEMILDDVEMEKLPSVCGIDVVRPKINNARIAAQEGLFLMPRFLGKSFETNLIHSLPYSKRKGKIENTSQYSVLKYVFKREAIDEARRFVANMRITYKMIYPDITGLAKSVTEQISYRD